MPASVEFKKETIIRLTNKIHQGSDRRIEFINATIKTLSVSSEEAIHKLYLDIIIHSLVDVDKGGNA